MACEQCSRKKHRDETEYKDLLTRLNRIEGQVRGIKKNGGRRRVLHRYFNSGDGGNGGA